MSKDTLGYIADKLLATAERDSSAPGYTDNTFRRKLNLAHHRESRLPLPRTREGTAYLLQREWIEVTERARLTPKQILVMQLRLEGETFDSIGRKYGHTKQGAQRIYVQGAKKLARAWLTNPHRGLPAVYDQETRRGLPPRRA